MSRRPPSGIWLTTWTRCAPGPAGAGRSAAVRDSGASGQAPFMQKNVPKYTPSWVQTVTVWAEASKREVSYALCNDRRTLLWFANQRAVEYHPSLVRAEERNHPTHLVLDLDSAFRRHFRFAVLTAYWSARPSPMPGCRAQPEPAGPRACTCTSRWMAPRRPGHSRGHPGDRSRPSSRSRDRHHSLPCRTTVGERSSSTGRGRRGHRRRHVSPRVRASVPVSFPVAWEELDDVAPGDFTVHTTVSLLAASDP